MAKSTANTVPGIDLANDASITRQDLYDAIDLMEIGDLSRAHVASTASIPDLNTTAPSASLVNGEVWVDRTDPGSGSGTTKAHTLKTYNGSVFRPVTAFDISATVPTYTLGEGMAWYDTTLDTLRIYSSVNGIDDLWHPLNEGLLLVRNGSGNTRSAGSVFRLEFGTPTILNAASPSFAKDPTVFCVSLEEITDGGRGVCALVTSDRLIEILVDTSVTTIAAGDGIIAQGTTCNSIGCGPLRLDNGPNATAGQQFTGVPFGCYAVATEAASAGAVELVTCRLLGGVGKGRDLLFGQDELATQATALAKGNWDGGWDELDITNAEDSGDIIATNGDAHHGPVLGVYIEGEVTVDSTAGVSTAVIDMKFGPNASAVMGRVVHKNYMDGGNPTGTVIPRMYIPTAGGLAGGYTVLGNILTWSGTITVPATSSISSASLYVVGYRY
jgi:hypothetical protein